MRNRASLIQIFFVFDLDSLFSYGELWRKTMTVVSQKATGKPTSCRAGGTTFVFVLKLGATKILAKTAPIEKIDQIDHT